MSGIEVVGVALAILPIIISAVEHYEDCIRPIRRYRKLALEVRDFERRLSIQNIIFLNQCRILLEGIVERERTQRMLINRSADPSWKDEALERCLDEHLGESKKSCVTSIELIAGRLSLIRNDCQRLRDVVDLDKEIKHRWLKKLRASLTDPQFNKHIKALRELNNDFTRLSKQISSSRYGTKPGEKPSVVKENDSNIQRYTLIRAAAGKVYAALVRACTKHSEHVALLCMPPVCEQTDIINENQIRFRIAFGRSPLAGISNDRSAFEQDKPLWFLIDSLDTEQEGAHYVRFDLDRSPEEYDVVLSKSLKRELGCDVVQKPRKKSVRFDIKNPSPRPTEAFPPPIDVQELPLLRTDFCDVLRKRTKVASPSPDCLGVLAVDGASKHRIYTSPAETYLQAHDKSALSDLIGSRPRFRNCLSTYDKVHLAKVLSIAVLQYHSTPWINLAWRSHDIFFFLKQTSSHRTAMDFSSPHINVSVTDGQQSHRQPAFPVLDLAPNPLLFSLGIILLELAYASNISSLQQKSDFENDRPGQYTDFFVAKRLSDTVVGQMGCTYSKVVKKLLQCNFGQGDDLSDPKLQGLFYRDVVCELDKLERQYRDLKIA